MLFPKNDTLVAIMKSILDFNIAMEENWYRIPVSKAPPIIRDYQAKYIAFYHTKIFDKDKYSIRYIAKIKNITIVNRKELFQDEPFNETTLKDYYKISFSKLTRLKNPVISNKGRRIVFIPTNKTKLLHAPELNYIFNSSPLDNLLWNEFVKNNIFAEREFYLRMKNKIFCLDFALFCRNGNINVECDGDTYHNKAANVFSDKKRNNILTSNKWAILRYTTDDLKNNLHDSISQVKETISNYGGIL